MRKVLSLQKLPFTSAEMLLNSTSSVQCTSGVVPATEANSGCSVQCTSGI